MLPNNHMKENHVFESNAWFFYKKILKTLQHISTNGDKMEREILHSLDG